MLQGNNHFLLPVLKDGIVAAWPICLAYLPLGMALGVIGQQAGLSPFDIGLMSFFVYAGSAQFIAVSMLSSGSAVIPIVVTTFIINLRHFLMSSSLSVYFKDIKKRWITLFAYGVTDESFVMNYMRFKETAWDWRRALVLNHTANVAWIGATVAGGYAGQLIPQGSFGIDYALTALFISLLAFQLKSMLYIITAIISGAVAFIWAMIFEGNSYVIAASIIAATIGVMMNKMKKSAGRK